jgi:glycerol kinase
LTAGAVHATDPTNASRTLLYDIYRTSWDEELLDLFGVPASMLPEVRPSSGDFGSADLFGARIPIGGVAGDQQSALFGQACFSAGDTKNTYGTGSFVLMNLGGTAPKPPEGLLVTLACGTGLEPVYALEGAIFVTGAAIQWLRDGLGVIGSAQETGPLAESVPDTGGVVFVPALTGLGSPHWDSYARGSITGITRGTTRAHLARATVEAMVYQTRDVVEAMQSSAGVSITELKVDGGASVMNLLCQLQADQLGVPVRRPVINETTALGAAFLAGLHTKVWNSTDEIVSAWKLDQEFQPQKPDESSYSRWKQAVDSSRKLSS